MNRTTLAVVLALSVPTLAAGQGAARPTAPGDEIEEHILMEGGSALSGDDLDGFRGLLPKGLEHGVKNKYWFNNNEEEPALYIRVPTDDGHYLVKVRLSYGSDGLLEGAKDGIPVEKSFYPNRTAPRSKEQGIDAAQGTGQTVVPAPKKNRELATKTAQKIDSVVAPWVPPVPLMPPPPKPISEPLNKASSEANKLVNNGLRTADKIADAGVDAYKDSQEHAAKQFNNAKKAANAAADSKILFPIPNMIKKRIK